MLEGVKPPSDRTRGFLSLVLLLPLPQAGGGWGGGGSLIETIARGFPSPIPSRLREGRAWGERFAYAASGYNVRISQSWNSFTDFC